MVHVQGRIGGTLLTPLPITNPTSRLQRLLFVPRYIAYIAQCHYSEEGGW